MSLDTTSHRDKPADLVRSGYALRVGEIDALVVSDGTMSIPAATLAVNAAPADLGAWLDGMFLPARFGWPLNVGVVRSGGRTVLIDAGLGTGGGVPGVCRGGAVDPATGSRRPRSRIPDRRGAHPHAHGPHWRAAWLEGSAAAGPAGPRVGQPRLSSGRGRPISPAPPCRRGCRSRFGRSPSGSWTSTTADCSRSRRNTRWRRGCSSVAPAATPPGTAWSAWSLAATG